MFARKHPGGFNERNGPKKLDSFSNVFKCTVAWGYAALGSGFRW